MIFQPEMLDTNNPVPEKRGRHKKAGPAYPMRVDMDAVRRAFGSEKTDAFDAAPTGRHAVVAAILRDSPRGPEVLLIRRAEHELDPWSGHMALPGGHGDAVDDSLAATALREVAEEVGLDLLEHAELLGRLPEVIALPRQLTIYPLVFALESGHEPRANPAEVQEVVWASLEHLSSPSAQSSHELSVRREGHHFPAFDVGGRVVWGLTYRILGDLLRTLRRGDTAGPGLP
jgi:8-oxo-dGTP pyrophosphatase MutT (NUDIX family)